jgi:hypothetical protein
MRERKMTSRSYDFFSRISQDWRVSMFCSLRHCAEVVAYKKGRYFRLSTRISMMCSPTG